MRNNRKLLHGTGVVTALALAAALVACGGGSDSSSPGSSSTTQLSGVAAVGAPLKNATIKVYDKTGATKTATTGSDGAYSVDITGMSAPLMIVADAGTFKLVSGRNFRQQGNRQHQRNHRYGQ